MNTYNFGGSKWRNPETFISLSFICWNCNNNVASDKGYRTEDANSKKKIYICPYCKAPNVFDMNGKIILSPLIGREIEKLPENIMNVYDEVRKCMQSTCFTGAVMLMRKIIMNIAVHEGAGKNKSFVEYINYLCDNGIVHKKSKNKADSIRELGNNANHEIENRTEEEAQNCFEFIELLLMENYEFADEVEEDGS
jgi:hypothetical protein